MAAHIYLVYTHWYMCSKHTYMYEYTHMYSSFIIGMKFFLYFQVYKPTIFLNL